MADPEVPGRAVAPTSEIRASGQRRRPPGCAVGSPCEGSGTCAAAAAVGRTPRVRQDAGAGPRRPGRVALSRRVCCFSRRTGSDVGLALLCGLAASRVVSIRHARPAAVALSGCRALSHAVPWLRAGPAGGHPPRGFGQRRGGRLGCRFLTLQRSGCVFLSAESESCPPGRTVQRGRSSEDGPGRTRRAAAASSPGVAEVAPGACRDAECHACTPGCRSVPTPSRPRLPALCACLSRLKPVAVLRVGASPLREGRKQGVGLRPAGLRPTRLSCVTAWEGFSQRDGHAHAGPCPSGRGSCAVVAGGISRVSSCRMWPGT